MLKVTDMSLLCGMSGESHAAVGEAVTVCDGEVKRGLMTTGRCATVDTHTVRFTVLEGP